MGNIFRRRRQAKEELDEIVAHIKDLEASLTRRLETRSRCLRFLLPASFSIFVISAAYIWLLYRNIRKRFFLLCAALVGSLILFFVLRFALQAFWGYLIEKKKRRIQFYTDRKFDIIEDVKENEKFKVAKEIIEKYGNREELSALSGMGVNGNDSARTSSAFGEIKNPPDVRKLSVDQRRTAISSECDPKGASPVEETPSIPKLQEFQRSSIRPFVETTNTPFDRILDYMMGESISNRYALICTACRAHNGMALAEEFEQIAFYCFKCNAYNPSRSEIAALRRKEFAQHIKIGSTVLDTHDERKPTEGEQQCGDGEEYETDDESD